MGEGGPCHAFSPDCNKLVKGRKKTGEEGRGSVASVTSCRDVAKWLTAGRAGKITSAPAGPLKTETVLCGIGEEFMSHDQTHHNPCALPGIHLCQHAHVAKQIERCIQVGNGERGECVITQFHFIYQILASFYQILNVSWSLCRHFRSRSVSLLFATSV